MGQHGENQFKAIESCLVRDVCPAQTVCSAQAKTEEATTGASSQCCQGCVPRPQSILLTSYVAPSRRAWHAFTCNPDAVSWGLENECSSCYKAQYSSC